MAFIYKAALCTIPRFGIVAILFLCTGLFFIFLACDTFLLLREEKLAPWELIGTANNEVLALEKLLSIEGIERISPVIQFDTEIHFGEYKLNCRVQAVHSSFLDIELSEGAIFHDNTNMPFILLNQAAAESFLTDNSKITVNTNVMMTVNNEATNALICGIFDDEKETPVVYISYEFASKTSLHQTETNLLFALSNKGSIEQVVPDLQRKGISAIYDQNEIALWEIKKQQVWQFVLTSVSFLFCVTEIVKNRFFYFHKVENEENYALALAGMSMQQIRWISFFRLIILYVFSLVAVFWISFLVGIFSQLAVIVVLFLFVFNLFYSWISQMYK